MSKEGNVEEKTSRRNYVKYVSAGVIGAAAVSAVEIPVLYSQIGQDNAKLAQKDQQISQLNSQVSQLRGEVTTAMQGQGFLTLNPKERLIVEALAEAVIPTDASGPGAKEAGAIYFIDRMLAGNYGKSGNMYMQGPFILPNPTNPITVDGITYPEGTISPRLQAGTAYQYAFNLREFWRRGLTYLEDYSNSAYGADFETLSSDNQIKVLQDLFDNKPTNFQGPIAPEFFNEIHDMVTAGFWTDPLYGGNIGMVGWTLLGFPGVNNGQAQGYTDKQLMVMDHPVRLPPISLGDIQRQGM